jgi:protein associated with RNAse G/E
VKKLCIGDKLQIQCYKHNGKIHRAWDEAVLLDIKKDYMVFGNNKTKVTESEGSVWKTKEPAIMYFFRNEWFNIIAQLKKDGIYYYCNIASPFIIEDNTIKYIDYDLDLRIFPSGEYKVLDKMEYKYHKKLMEYSDELDVVINGAMDDLIKKYIEKVPMFNAKNNYEYEKVYNNIKEYEVN